MIGVNLNPAANAKVSEVAAKTAAKTGTVDMSKLSEILPKSFLYGGLVVTVLVLLLACCGCCGAITMKRAADNSKSETNDEYDYADLNETSSTSPALLIYIIIMLLFIILELAMGAMAATTFGDMGNAATQNKADKLYTKGKEALEKRTRLITESSDKKIQKEWRDVQDSLDCCGMWDIGDATDGKDGDQSTTEANLGESCCIEPSMYDPSKDGLNKCSSGWKWQFPGAFETNSTTCNHVVFTELRKNVRAVMIFCFVVFVIEILCVGSAIHLRCCSVKKKE